MRPAMGATTVEYESWSRLRRCVARDSSRSARASARALSASSMFCGVAVPRSKSCAMRAASRSRCSTVASCRATLALAPASSARNMEESMR